MNPLVCRVLGEAAEPDDFSAKDYLLSMPQEFSGYAIHISANTEEWGVGTQEQADQVAHRLAEMAKAEFPGIQTDVSLGPNTFISMGKDVAVMEQIDAWLTDHLATPLP